MIKKITAIATLALLTAACSTTPCQRRGCGCRVVISDATVKEAAGTGLKPVLFDFDSATLTPAGERALAERVDLLKQSNRTFTIVGHTDSTGSDEYNMDLSQRRAESAKAFFVKNGVSAKRLSTRGVGEAEPVADNGTAAGRAQNRRIEIEVGS